MQAVKHIERLSDRLSRHRMAGLRKIAPEGYRVSVYDQWLNFRPKEVDSRKVEIHEPAHKGDGPEYRIRVCALSGDLHHNGVNEAQDGISRTPHKYRTCHVKPGDTTDFTQEAIYL